MRVLAKVCRRSLRTPPRASPSSTPSRNRTTDGLWLRYRLTGLFIPLEALRSLFRAQPLLALPLRSVARGAAGRWCLAKEGCVRLRRSLTARSRDCRPDRAGSRLADRSRRAGRQGSQLEDRPGRVSRARRRLAETATLRALRRRSTGRSWGRRSDPAEFCRGWTCRVGRAPDWPTGGSRGFRSVRVVDSFLAGRAGRVGWSRGSSLAARYLPARET
jgi:hypothetical protein